MVKLVREVARRASCAFVLVSHMEALASTLHPARQLDETPSALPEDGAPSARLLPPGARAAPTRPEAPPAPPRGSWEARGGLRSSPRPAPKAVSSHVEPSLSLSL